MAIIRDMRKRGFTLLVAVIFSSVFLALALTLGSLAYKQQVLASSASASQVAFYAADTALECALYADEQGDLFDYSTFDPNNTPKIYCGDIRYRGNPGGLSYSPDPDTQCYNTNGCLGQLVLWYRVDLNTNPVGQAQCADLYIYKASNGGTNIFSQGYNVSCPTVANLGSARMTARGLTATYGP